MIEKSKIASNKIVLQIKGLRKSFGENHVLNGFNMELYRGEN